MAMETLTLLTDFGTRDFFVGALKGAVLKACPSCRIVDISHEVEIFDIRRAAFLLWATWRSYPEGTVHLTVVDPGVGTQRALLHMERDGHHFFAPDNGLLTYVHTGQEELHRVLYPADLKAAASPTFHARDLFAPTVGRFLGDQTVEMEPCADAIMLPYQPPLKGEDGSVRGQVMEVDRFGNLITDLPLAWMQYGRGSVKVRGRALGIWTLAYEELQGQDPGMLPGSLGTLEIAVRKGSAARALGSGIGDPVAYQP
jgi:S-adenosylmethionine hydrolase